MDKLYTDLLKKLYKAKAIPKEIDIPTATRTAHKLMEAVFKGYGNTFATLAYNTPDYDKLMHLEQNVYQFSGAKNWQMMKEITLLIKDGDKILPYREFRNKAIPVLEDYDYRFLKTEYNAAIAGSQMAAKWVDIERSADLAREKGLPEPLLQYHTQEADRVRESHRALNRITRPPEHNFWKTYYPPNGWNCRCTVVRLNDAKQSSDQDTNRAMADVTPQKGFTTNLAKEGFVFPKNSAYYVGIPEDVKKAHKTIQKEVMREFAKVHLVGNKYPSVIGQISITMKGIDKTLMQPHSMFFEKNASLYKLPEILKDAKLISSAPDRKGKVVAMHYMEITLSNNAKSFIAVKESNNGDLNLYTIQDNNKAHKNKNG